MRPLLALALVLVSASVRADTILVIGDSHMDGDFGKSLESALRGAGNHRVAVFGVCDARPASYLTEKEHHCGHYFRGIDGQEPKKWVDGRTRPGTVPYKGRQLKVTWIKTPPLDQLLADYAPDVVVVALGTNPIDQSGIDTLIDRIHKDKKSCVWVGPPDTRNPGPAHNDTVYAMLAAKGARVNAVGYEAQRDACFLIESTKLTSYPAQGGDGTHYGGALAPSAARWGSAVGQKILTWLQ